MVLATGDVDQLADSQDIDWLLSPASGLKKDKLLLHHSIQHFGHVSFVMANSMDWFKDEIIPYIQK